jgi:hypothetical protein
MKNRPLLGLVSKLAMSKAEHAAPHDLPELSSGVYSYYAYEY